MSDIEGLGRSIEQTINLLDRASEWINGVLDEDEEPNNIIGQYLMNALSLAPKVDPSQIESDFNNHIQDVLMVSYLANTIRTQIDLSQRLAVATFTPAEKDGENKSEEKGGQRGGKRGGRGGGRGGQQRGEPRESREPREPRESREPREPIE